MEIDEIARLKDNCIQEEPPYCSAACPVHVDVRLLMKSIQQADYDRAYKAYARKVMFPGIISRVCDEPCWKSCIRNKLDDPLSIRLLERAVVDHAESKDPGVYAAPRKNRRVSVVGGGLTGMCCALDLARKGYSVAIFEKSGRLGGRLRDIDSSVLPPEVLDEEVRRLEDEGVETSLSTEINGLEDLEYDACFVAAGGEHGGLAGLLPRDESNPEYRITLESPQKGVFVVPAGNDKEYSPIVAVLQGMQASRSIERYLKKTSVFHGRENELSTDTCLYTNISGEEKKPAIAPSHTRSGYTREEAAAEASRCLLCECLECDRHCLYLETYGAYPKTYIADLAAFYSTPNVAYGSGGGRFAHGKTHLLNACSLCGLCKEVCPTDVDMGRANSEIKKLIWAAGRLPAAFHDFWLRDMAAAGGDDSFLVRSQPGISTSKYLFFPGCQLGASDPGYVMNTYRYLTERVSGGVGLYLGCCGAPADWSGRADLLEESIRTIRKNWEQQGNPEMILACPTCHKMFARHLNDVPVKSLWDIFNEQGLPDGHVQGNGVEIALYDPCSSRYLPGVQKSVRSLLSRMGYAVEELRMNRRYAQCCSYGGLISTVNPKLAREIRDQRVSASARDYVTYCPNCRDDFAGNGKPTWHLLDIIFGGGSVGGALKTPPGRSQRLENRREVKFRMMETYWGEKMERPKQEHEAVKLILCGDVEKKMDDRFILLDEVKQVILNAEKSGAKFVDKESGHNLAHLRIGHVTYWVEYEPCGDRYKLHKAYSHRIQIIEESDQNGS
jgi:glutamate synthase (NADPH/NADH) small chain